MIIEHQVSQRQACNAVGLAQSTIRYKPRVEDDGPVITELQSLVEKHPAIGFWQSYFRLRRKGHPWDYKRVYRVYTDLKLNVRRRFRKRLPTRITAPLTQPDAANHTWSVDFMSDTLWDGRKFRLLNVVDDFNRELIHIELDTSLPTTRLIRVLGFLKEFGGCRVQSNLTMALNSYPANSTCGAKRTRLIYFSSNLENRRKTAMWNDAMEISAASS